MQQDLDKLFRNIGLTHDFFVTFPFFKGNLFTDNNVMLFS